MKKPSQRDLFLSLLRERGSRGVHTFELRGMFIGNPSQRKAELERDGFVLDVSPKERFRGQAWGKRYTLVSEPEAEQEPSRRIATRAIEAGASAPAESLFDVGPSNGYEVAA